MDCIDTFINLIKVSQQTTWRSKRQATDLIWSKNTYRLDRTVQEPGNRVLYYLQDGPDRAFVHEELMHIPENTQVPPDWVSEWK